MGILGPRRWTTLVPASLLLALLGPAAGSPATATPPPPQPGQPGAQQYYAQWAEVLTVTDQWLVLRSREGEQYPVAVDAIGQFLIRWPTTLDRISPEALLEVTGQNVHSNRILTDQVDVYEGPARQLVTPGLQVATNRGYTITPMDFLFNADAYGAPFPGLENPIQGGQEAPASLIHLVGPLLSRFPLMVGFPLQTGFVASGNAFVIVPGPAGVTFSQVTLGSPGMVQEGDLVYFVATSVRPRSLILAQLVVYKTIPLDQFAPRRR